MLNWDKKEETMKTLDLVVFRGGQTRFLSGKGFTLAEVLITLGIIGIVAAMTLPSVINNNKSKVFQTSLQAAYTILQEGLAKMSADYGYTITSSNFERRTNGEFYNVYKTYYKKIYDCSVLNPNESVCMTRNNKNEAGLSTDPSYKSFSGNEIKTSIFDDGQFVLPNGMLIMFEDTGYSIIYISVDINGKRQKPNRWGYDVFTFQLMNDGKLLPMGAEGTDYENTDNFCSKQSKHYYNGIACTYKAITDKDFWKNL